MREPSAREPAASGTRRGPTGAFKPVDAATHLYLLAISILVAVFAFESAWPHIIATIGCSAALVGVQIATRRRSPETQAVVRIVYFVIFIPALYLQLKSLIPAVHPRALHGGVDETLRSFDRAIFGADPTVALEAIVHPVATEILQLAYTSYYILPIIVPVLLLRRGRVVETEKYALALFVTYYVTYLGYIAVPANGPGATIVHGEELRGLLLAEPLWNLIRNVDADRFDCFPSGHTAVAVLVAIYAWRSRVRVVTPILVADAFLIVIATVYMRYHYVVDLPPGIVLAVVSFGIAEWVYRGRSDDAPEDVSPSKRRYRL